MQNFAEAVDSSLVSYVTKYKADFKNRKKMSDHIIYIRYV